MCRVGQTDRQTDPMSHAASWAEIDVRAFTSACRKLLNTLVICRSAIHCHVFAITRLSE